MSKRSQTHPSPAPVPMPVAQASPAAGDVNQAASYGARVVPVEVPTGGTYWKLVELRHLSPDENRGKHNVYVDIRDENGNRTRDPALRIGWAWEGQHADEPAPPAPLDKPDNEPAGNVELNKGQHLQVWIQGDGLPSDRAENLHSEHEGERASDGTEGNYRYHHSYQVTFQRSRKEAAGAVTPAVVTTTSTGSVRPTSGSAEAVGVTSDALNLRTGPDTAYAVVRVLPAGMEVTILEEVGAWLRVKAGADQGFVFGEWVQRQGAPQPVPPPVPAPPAGGIQLPPGASAIDQQVANTWNRFGGLLMEQAQALGIDPAVAVAVLAAEAAGEPFGADGRLIIRFENHIFYRYWGKDHPDQFAQCFTFDSNESWRGHQWRPNASAPWQSFHGDQNAEWQVLTFARSLDDTAALLSISMGAPQIMGFNHAMVGYPTVQELFAAFQADIRAQVASLFRFMQVNNLVDAVRRGDFLTFARTYNGPGAAGEYQRRIQERMEAFNRLRQVTADMPAGAAAVPIPAIPQPGTGVPGATLKELDPELYAAWSKHIQQGFMNNQTMFSRVLDAFLNPYWTTVWMYRILFGVGVAAFVVAGVLAVFNANLPAAALFGGLGVVAFLTYFVSRPLQALEENLQFITWLGIIYNTYWTRLVFAQNPETFQQDAEQITVDAIAKINELLAKHAERSGTRPGLR